MNNENASSESSAKEGGSSSGRFLKLMMFVVLLAGAAGALYAAGGNEISLVVSEEIESGNENLFDRRKKVYRLLTLPDYMPKWHAGLQSIEFENADAGHSEGAKAKVIIEMNGKEIIFDEEVLIEQNEKETEFQRTSDAKDELHNFKIDFDTRDYDDDARKTSGVVTVTHSCRITHKGMSRFMAVFQRSALESKMKKDLAELKKLAEDEGLEVKKPPRKAPPRQRRKGGGRNAWKNEQKKSKEKEAQKAGEEKSNKKTDDKSVSQKEKKSEGPSQ